MTRNVAVHRGGKKTDWDTIRKNTDQPIITIITSTYNVINDLPWTMESIKNQTYPHIQWIVADGASSDGTVELLQQYSDMIDYWFSAPDAGIYDAWNKALKHVKGDWVQFLGAGDELYEVDTLEKAAQYLKNAHPEHSLVYGQVMHISEKGRKELYVSGEPWENYAGRWGFMSPDLPQHPGIFAHASLFETKPAFDTKFIISADCHFILRNLKGNQMKYMPFIVDKMPLGGVTGSIKSSFVMKGEIQQIINELEYKLPLKVVVMDNLKIFIRRIFLKFFDEKQVKYFYDLTRVLRGKPKIWTIE